MRALEPQPEPTTQRALLLRRVFLKRASMAYGIPSEKLEGTQRDCWAVSEARSAVVLGLWLSNVTASDIREVMGWKADSTVRYCIQNILNAAEVSPKSGTRLCQILLGVTP